MNDRFLFADFNKNPDKDFGLERHPCSLRTKKADPEGSAFFNHLCVDPSAGIIQVRFSGSMTVSVTLSAGLTPTPRDIVEGYTTKV